jgi:hypothetical protein
LLSPSTFIPPSGKKVIQGAALTAIIRKHVGFAASSVFVALLIFQLVGRRAPVGSAWDAIAESLPLSLLVVGSWVIWSLLVAFILKLVGATRPPEINVVFGVRVLATLYVVAMLAGTLAFLTFGSQWAIFAAVEFLIGSLAYAIYVPLVFVGANNIQGRRIFGFLAPFALIFIGKSALELVFLLQNPYVPPATAPPPIPEPEPPKPEPQPEPPKHPTDVPPAGAPPTPPIPEPEPPKPEPTPEEFKTKYFSTNRGNLELVAPLGLMPQSNADVLVAGYSQLLFLWELDFSPPSSCRPFLEFEIKDTMTSTWRKLELTSYQSDVVHCPSSSQCYANASSNLPYVPAKIRIIVHC